MKNEFQAIAQVKKEKSALTTTNRAVSAAIKDEMMSLSAAFKALRKAKAEILVYATEKAKRKDIEFDANLANKIINEGDLKSLTVGFDVIDQAVEYWTADGIKTAFYRAVGLANARTKKNFYKFSFSKACKAAIKSGRINEEQIIEAVGDYVPA